MLCRPPPRAANTRPLLNWLFYDKAQRRKRQSPRQKPRPTRRPHSQHGPPSNPRPSAEVDRYPVPVQTWLRLNHSRCPNGYRGGAQDAELYEERLRNLNLKVTKHTRHVTHTEQQIFRRTGGNRKRQDPEFYDPGNLVTGCKSFG